MDFINIWNIVKDYIGWIAGILGLVYAIRADKKQKEQERLQKEKDARNEYLFEIAELHVDKNIKQEEIEVLNQEANQKQTTLQILSRKIQEDIPRMAQRTLALEQLSLARNNVVDAYQKWQRIQQQFPEIESDDATLPLEITKVIDEQIQPEFIRKEKIASWQYILAVLGSLTALAGIFQGLFKSNFLIFVVILFALGTVAALVEIYILRQSPIKIRQLLTRTIPLVAGYFLSIGSAIGVVLMTNVDFYYHGDNQAMKEVNRYLRNNYFILSCFLLMGMLIGFLILFLIRERQKNIFRKISRLYSHEQIKDTLEFTETELSNDPDNSELFEKYLDLLFENDEPERAADIWFKKFAWLKTKNPITIEKRKKILNFMIGNSNKAKVQIFLERLVSLVKDKGSSHRSLQPYLERRLEDLLLSKPIED